MEAWRMWVRPGLLQTLDVSVEVQKYVMPDEEYEKLENSVRAIKRREKEKAIATSQTS